MGLFSRSKISSDEYADLLGKYAKLQTDITIVKHQVETVESKLASVSGRMNQLKRGKSKNTEEEEEEEESETITEEDRTRAQLQLLGIGGADR